MRVYHQCGHNTIWNIDSLEKEKSGDGLIISPVNLDAASISRRIRAETLSKCFFDPQFYLPYDPKKNLQDYPFFPANVVDENTTNAIDEKIDSIAFQCLEYQKSLGLQYLVIPTRYYEIISGTTLDELSTTIVEPFVRSYETNDFADDLLLTSIVSQAQLEQKESRDELLSWLTGFDEVAGIYLIFDHSFTSKQIVNPGYLSDALGFIEILRNNELEVHIGYSGLEGILYSIADPTSVSVGAYENLRRFDIARMETTDSSGGGPATARIFSDKLIQNIPVTLAPALDKLCPSWKLDLIPETMHKEFLMEDPQKLHFAKAELYKHYFAGMADLVSKLPEYGESRTAHVDDLARRALEEYEMITNTGIVFGADASAEHLVAWRNAIAMYQAGKSAS